MQVWDQASMRSFVFLYWYKLPGVGPLTLYLNWTRFAQHHVENTTLPPYWLFIVNLLVKHNNSMIALKVSIFHWIIHEGRGFVWFVFHLLILHSLRIMEFFCITFHPQIMMLISLWWNFMDSSLGQTSEKKHCVYSVLVLCPKKPKDCWTKLCWNFEGQFLQL